MIVSWPAKIQAGSKSDHLSAFWDFLPTMAELVDQPLKVPTDGVSMLPTFLGGEGQKQHEYLYWEFPARGGRIAVRKGKWKAVRYNAKKTPHSTLELYDLSTDESEVLNVAAAHPEVLSEMRVLLEGVRVAPKNPRFDYLLTDKDEKRKKKRGQKK